MTINFIHNIVEDNGKTIKENNMLLEHSIPVESLVEIESGVRLFVYSHNRDCDGTPLYRLTIFKDDPSNTWGGYTVEDLELISAPKS